MTMKVQKTENTGIVYATPTEPDLSVRVKHQTAKKSLAGVAVTNQVTEIIWTDANEVDLGAVKALDAVSVRVRVSGSLQSTDRKKSLCAAMRTTLAKWENEDVLSGFNPTSVPDSPQAGE